MSDDALSYWERELGVTRGASMGALPDLPDAVDILIVGAGFCGSWLALFLAREFTAQIHRGMRPKIPSILVIERDNVGLGASTRNAGFLTSGHLSEMLADADEHGLDAVEQSFLQRHKGVETVFEHFGQQLELKRSGSVDWDEPTAAHHALAERLNDRLEQIEAPPVFVLRDLPSAQGERKRYVNLADSACQPLQLLQTIRGEAEALGVRFCFGVEAHEVEHGSARVKTAQGKEHELRYRQARLCLNAFSTQLDVKSPVQPGRGQVIVTSPVELPFGTAPGYLHLGYDYFRGVDGRLLVGGGRHRFQKEETSHELVATSQVKDYLRGVAAELLGHQNFTVEHHWAGVMGFPGGSHCVGVAPRKVDESTQSLAGFGGMGVALTPVVAQSHARDMADDWR